MNAVTAAPCVTNLIETIESRLVCIKQGLSHVVDAIEGPMLANPKEVPPAAPANGILSLLHSCSEKIDEIERLQNSLTRSLLG